jgi:hypothetical protein
MHPIAGISDTKLIKYLIGEGSGVVRLGGKLDDSVGLGVTGNQLLSANFNNLH